MAYSGTVRHVLISCPGDVSASGDREAIYRAITRWNALYGRQFATAVVPLTWDWHAAPEYGARPQASLNKQLVDSADFVIALFWHRLGSPTGEAASGTVEEIERAHSLGKPVSVLVCRRDVPRDKLDPTQTHDLDQYLKSIQDRCLYLNYDTADDLARHIDTVLARMVTSEEAATRLSAAEQAASVADVWPRVDIAEYADSDARGQLARKRSLYLVLSNTGTEMALNVSLDLEPERDGDQVPLVVGADERVTALAPGSDYRFTVIPAFGTASQARCTVSWTDSRGIQERAVTLRFV